MSSELGKLGEIRGDNMAGQSAALINICIEVVCVSEFGTGVQALSACSPSESGGVSTGRSNFQVYKDSFCSNISVRSGSQQIPDLLKLRKTGRVKFDNLPRRNGYSKICNGTPCAQRTPDKPPSLTRSYSKCWTPYTTSSCSGSHTQRPWIV